MLIIGDLSVMNDAEIKFLKVYQFYQGNGNKALKACGIEENHLNLWMEDDDFAQNFYSIRSEIASYLLSEFRFNYLKMVQNLVVNGCREKQVTRTTQTNKNGVTTIRSSSKTTIKMIPESYIKNLLNYENVENSINNLAQQGLIPKSIARKFLTTAYEYQSKLQECFGTDEDSDKLSDEKAIALVKQALLGSGEEIS